MCSRHQSRQYLAAYGEDHVEAGCPPAEHGVPCQRRFTLQLMDDPTPQQLNVPWRKLKPVEIPCRKRLLSGSVADGVLTTVCSWRTAPDGKDPHLSSSWKTAICGGDPTVDQRKHVMRKEQQRWCVIKLLQPPIPHPPVLLKGEEEESHKWRGEIEPRKTQGLVGRRSL